MTVLETERLTLRPFGEADLDDWVAVVADPEVTRFLGGRPRSRDGEAAKLASTLEHWRRYGFGLWAAVEREAGRLAGLCGVAYLHGMGDAELAYVLARRCWGRGLATEAAGAAEGNRKGAVKQPQAQSTGSGGSSSGGGGGGGGSPPSPN